MKRMNRILSMLLGGGSVLFDREDIQNWLLEQHKTEKERSK